MNTSVWLAGVLVVVPLVGLVAWAWLTLARFAARLRDIGGFEGMHFEV